MRSLYFLVIYFLIFIVCHAAFPSDVFDGEFFDVEIKTSNAYETKENSIKNIKDKYWIIFFRRAMIELANILASNIDAVAIITGESVGQVASQTLSNIRAISHNSKLPIIRPLSGMNKDEIINKAKAVLNASDDAINF